MGTHTKTRRILKPKTCDRIRENFADFLGGDLDEGTLREVRAHLTFQNFPGSGWGGFAASKNDYKAFQAGADYIVVGRPIRDAADPRAAAERIQAEIAAVFA